MVNRQWQLNVTIVSRTIDVRGLTSSTVVCPLTPWAHQRVVETAGRRVTQCIKGLRIRHLDDADFTDIIGRVETERHGLREQVDVLRLRRLHFCVFHRLASRS